MVTRKASKKATKGSKGKARTTSTTSTKDARKATERKASAPKPKVKPEKSPKPKPKVKVKKKLVKDAPTDERITLPCTLAPIPLPANVRPCVVVTAEPDLDKIAELNRQYPKGIPNWEIERLSHKLQICWQRESGWAGRVFTAEWREKAVQRLKGLAGSYNFAADSYVHAPESERIHRTRLRDLGRILRATLDAHLLDNDTAREYLDTAANKARLFLDKLEGSKLKPFVGHFGQGPSAKRVIIEQCDEIDHMLLSVTQELDEGARRGSDSSKQTAKRIAGLLVHTQYHVFLDRLKDPTKFESTEQTAENVATAIRPILDNLETKEWSTPETSKNVVRAALRALGDKNPYDFFSNWDKKAKKHRAQKQSR